MASRAGMCHPPVEAFRLGFLRKQEGYTVSTRRNRQAPFPKEIQAERFHRRMAHPRTAVDRINEHTKHNTAIARF